MALARLDTWAEAGRWLPRSPYWRHYVRREADRRMAESNTPPQNPVLAFCPECGLAFLVDDSRPWSACHGADPKVTVDLWGVVELVNLLAERVLSTPPVSEAAPSEPAPQLPARTTDLQAPAQEEAPGVAPTPPGAPPGEDMAAAGEPDEALPEVSAGDGRGIAVSEAAPAAAASSRRRR